MNAILEPGFELTEVLSRISCGPSRARFYGIRKKNGREKWFIQKGGFQYEGKTPEEALKKLWMITNIYGWKW